MLVPDDPQEVGARFVAQVLGAELSDGPVPPGSPLWGLQLVRRLAAAAGFDDDDVSRVGKAYVTARWRWHCPWLDEEWS